MDFFEVFSYEFLKTASQAVAIVLILVIYAVLLPRIFRRIKTLLETGVRSSDFVDIITESLLKAVLPIPSSWKSKENKAQPSELKLEIEALQAGYENKIREIRIENLRDEKGKLTDNWIDALLISRNRLMSESKRLSSGSLNNLIMGIIFTSASALSVLFLFFIYSPAESVSSTLGFISSFLPRLTLVLLLQVSGSFFLKLYAQSESELKSNKNEVTNVELKIAAGLIAIKNPEMSEIANKLIDQERNFILEKNQRVAGWSERIEPQELVAFITQVMNSNGGDLKQKK